MRNTSNTAAGHQRCLRALLTVLACLAAMMSTAAMAQSEPDPAIHEDSAQKATHDPVETDPVERVTPVQEPAAPTADQAAAAGPDVNKPKDPKDYGWLVMAPAIVAILLAVVTRQVVLALVVGVVAGAYMLAPCLPPASPYADAPSVVGGFRLAAEKYVIGAIHEPPDQDAAHIKIMVFTLVIGFMVGVIGRNGGTAGLVRVVAGRTESPRRSGLTAWAAGLVVFFDDYANTMIVGPTMRSVFDRVKLSRAKLAYIVDSTAAPVASLALIGTWVGAEIGFIQVGLDKISADTAPEFLLNEQGKMIEGMQAFIASLPYRFYPILALFLVFVIAWTRRDFGPMKRAEAQAQTGKEDRPYESAATDSGSNDADQPTPRWWLGLLPVLVLVGATIAILAITGYSTADGESVMQQSKPWWEKAQEILKAGDSYLSIFYGAILSALVAVVLTAISRSCRVRDAADAGLNGMARMFPAIAILILAWALSAVEQDLQLGKVVGGYLQAAEFPAVWMPLSVFLCAAVVSFATGSSWGTMGILCPITVTVTAKLAGGLPAEQGLPLFYAAVGSVLAGAIFGDHCSPISDTTVLSSIAAGCRHESHVWTQLPYALVTAIVAMGLGDVLCSVYHQPWYYGLVAGALVLLLIVFVFGRRPQPEPEPEPEEPPPPSRPQGLGMWARANRPQDPQ